MKRERVAGPQGMLAVEVNRKAAGKPLLFVHGDACRASQWHAVIAPLDGDTPWASLDLRGHGDADPAADGDYSYAGRAAVALAYAAAQPRRVSGILMVEPVADPRALPEAVRSGLVRDLAAPDSLAVQQAFYASIAGGNEDTKNQVVRDVEAVAPAARLGVARAMAEWNPEPLLATTSVPVHCLLSDGGGNPAALYHLRPDFSHHVVHGTGHWLHLDRPGAVRDALMGAPFR